MSTCRDCEGYDSIISCTVNTLGMHHSVDDEPAIVWNDGEGWWFQNGKKHRVDRPAIESTESTSTSYYNKWYFNGLIHRLDGPAVTWYDDVHNWFYKGLGVSIEIPNQEIIIGKSVDIEEDVATVLKHVEGCFYEVLLGNKKVLVAKV